jgi:hypothetical protein
MFPEGKILASPGLRFIAEYNVNILEFSFFMYYQMSLILTCKTTNSSFFAL